MQVLTTYQLSKRYSNLLRVMCVMLFCLSILSTEVIKVYAFAQEITFEQLDFIGEDGSEQEGKEDTKEENVESDDYLHNSIFETSPFSLFVSHSFYYLFNHPASLLDIHQVPPEAIRPTV